MKFTVFVALSCLCICLANSAKDPKLTTWGDVNNGHILHKEKIFVASSFMQIRTFILEYPKVSTIDEDFIQILNMGNCLIFIFFTFSCSNREFQRIIQLLASNIMTTNPIQWKSNSKMVTLVNDLLH